MKQTTKLYIIYGIPFLIIVLGFIWASIPLLKAMREELFTSFPYELVLQFYFIVIFPIAVLLHYALKKVMIKLTK